ncbi:MAG: hypothetical protein ACYC06_05520 [Ilumatobacteraceae bacterium]
MTDRFAPFTIRVFPKIDLEGHLADGHSGAQTQRLRTAAHLPGVQTQDSDEAYQAMYRDILF